MQKGIILFFLFGIHLFSNGQSTNLTDTNSLPFEQINVVTDRDLYLSGEAIWFSATVQVNDKQESYSQIIYLELFNADQKSIVRGKYRIKQGYAQGILNIPSEFLSGGYFLRAYTQYNKNFPSEDFFLSALQIINPHIGLTSSVKKSSLAIELYQNSLSIKPSKTLAFSIPKNSINGEYQAFLYTDTVRQKEAVILKNGWGMINIPTSDSLKYSLVFTNSQGDTLKKNIDFIPSNTFDLAINTSSTGHHLVSIFSPNNSKNYNGIYTLELINTQLQVLSSTEFPLTNSQTQIVIPNSEIAKSGLHFFILKNEKKEIVKVYSYIFEEASSPNLAVETRTYQKRDLVSIKHSEIAGDNRANIGLKTIPRGTILPTLDKLYLYIDNPHLLFSYLRTQFNPSSLSSDEREIFLQILNYKLNTRDYLNLFYPPKAKHLKWIPEIRDIGLSGFIVDKNTQKPVPNIPVYLSIFRDHPQIHIYESREDGSFLFSLNNFEKEQDIFLCPLFKGANELELKVNRDFEVDFPRLNKIQLIIDSSYTQVLESLLLASQTPTAFNIIPKDKDSSIGHLPYSFENPQLSIVLDDYIETSSMEMVFRELVPDVRVRKKNNRYTLSIFDNEQELYYSDPMILVDDVPIFNLEELMKISPKVIEKIEVHKTPFILGDHTINGIIMIHSFTDNFGGMVMPKSSTFFEYQTVNPAYTYKAKSYATSKDLKSRNADFRTLLHWNPYIQKNSSNEMQFYTSDQTGEYEVYIFGNYKNGQAFHLKAFELEVKD